MRHVRSNLVGEPADMEWATENDVCGGLGDTGEGILDTLRYLLLIEYCRKTGPNTINEIIENERIEYDLRHSSASRRFQTGFALISRSRRILYEKRC
jgi:hypothetical protein